MDLEQLLEENKEYLERDTSANVVRCRLSGHAMPLRADAVAQYIRGKHFVKLRARAIEVKSLKQYEPHIVPSAYVSDRLFCRITGRLVHMNEAAVLRHSEGKRFQTQLEFVRAGSCLKNEAAPADAAAAAPASAAEDASQPAVWCPPAHVLASASEESDDEPAAGEDADGVDSDAGDGDSFDWDAAAEEDGAAPVVMQPRPRAADKAPRRKRQDVGAARGAVAKKGAPAPKRARKEEA